MVDNLFSKFYVVTSHLSTG